MVDATVSTVGGRYELSFEDFERYYRRCEDFQSGAWMGAKDMLPARMEITVNSAYSTCSFAQATRGSSSSSSSSRHPKVLDVGKEETKEDVLPTSKNDQNSK